MEKNTVLLSLKDYNEFRDFKRNSEDNYIPVWGACRKYYYYTKDKAIKEIAVCNVNLQDEINELNDRIDELENPSPKVEPSIIKLRRVKKMSIWQFIKWRRNG